MKLQDLDTIIFASCEKSFREMFLEGFWSALFILFLRRKHIRYAMVCRTEYEPTPGQKRAAITNIAPVLDVALSLKEFPKCDMLFSGPSEVLDPPIYRQSKSETIRGTRFTNYAWAKHLRQQGADTITNMTDHDAIDAWLAQNPSQASTQQKKNSFHPLFLLYLLLIIFRHFTSSPE